jgi:cytoskeletal protein CcmA (bactofilin family)
MWFVKHYLSEQRQFRKPRFYALGLVAVLAVVLPSITTFAALITTDRYIVRDGEVIAEDQYVSSTAANVEGTIDGDLTIFSGSLTITGEVTGSVIVFSVGSVTVAEGAVIGGSLQGTAGSLRVSGTVGSDVFVGAASIVIDPTGEIGRDVMGFGGALTIRGDVARDVRGRTMRTEISGDVGGDVDIATQGLDVTESARIEGDVLYRSPSDADIDEGAQISGGITRLPTRGNFIYGVILSLATVVSFLGFLVAGIVALWLFRTSSSRAIGSILRKPIRSFLVGLVTVIVFPALVLVLAMTLVGLPLAIVGVLIAGIAFIIGPVPAVTALGNRVLVNRGGLFGAFVVGAVLWRLGIWLIPVVGGFVYLIALVWGIGAWVMGFAAARRADETPPALLPASMIVKDEIPEGWVAPLAPQPTPKPAPEPERVAIPDVDHDTDVTSREDTPAADIDADDVGRVDSKPPAEPSDSTAPPTGESSSNDDAPPDADNWGLPRR